MRSGARFLGLGLVCFAAGCSSAGGGDAPDGGTPASFVAYSGSFTGFHQWPSFAASAADDAGDGLHGVGPLRVYINTPPAHGATSFPVGTIIVKETEQTDVTQRAAFAMVKHGEDFNSSGAVGWEWFSLQEKADDTVLVLWDVAPASNDTYAGQPIGDCNGCHEGARGNDFVWDTPLQLSKF